MKPFNRVLSLTIDGLHVRIDYIERLPQSDATKRRLKALRELLRKSERKVKA